MRSKGVLACLLGALVLFSAQGPAPAAADRALLSGYAEGKEEVLKTDPAEEIPPPEGEIEDACGLAVGPGAIYVSDYHHKAVDIFNPASGLFKGQIAVPVSNPPEGPCGLALDASGKLYTNVFHESALRLTAPILTFDLGEDANKPTGVAIDGAVKGASDVYVNDRTHVSVFDPSGAELQQIGAGSLGDAYGLAVYGGRVYVPDAANDTIKVYEPGVDLNDPVSTIEGFEGRGFVSLRDAAVAIDPTNGHLLVADNTKPGYEHPVAAIYEFDSSGAFLGRLPSCTQPPRNGCVVGSGPIDGEPPGLAVDPASGRLFVTTGNGENANAFEYGPYVESSLLSPPPPGDPPAPAPGGPGAAGLGDGARAGAGHSSEASASVVVQRQGVRVSFDGKLSPHVLPRHGQAPVGIAVDAKIAATGGDDPPHLRRIAIAINRNGRFTSKGLPLCRLRDIQPSTTTGARASCGSSLVGEGHFSADVKLPEQSPFPSEGKVLAFNGRVHGKPAILAHIYGAQPAPTSAVLPFQIRSSHGTYGTILEASLPRATGNWGFVTGLRMSLRRHFTYRGKSRSFLSAGCPAPPGFPSAAFPLARTDFDFAGGLTLVSVLSRTCRARG
jgi:DNA-binding beta-propeller fold protein YncE